jgi:hypothetical protein
MVKRDGIIIMLKSVPGKRGFVRPNHEIDADACWDALEDGRHATVFELLDGQAAAANCVPGGQPPAAGPAGDALADEPAPLAETVTHGTDPHKGDAVWKETKRSTGSAA